MAKQLVERMNECMDALINACTKLINELIN